jgi:two-component system cell cycle sensor histidine kinase/response regulator CckA
VLALPAARMTRSERSKLLLDSLIVALGTAVLLWVLFLRRVVEQQVIGDELGLVFVAMGYPICDILLVWAAIWLLLTRRDPESAALCRWTAAGALVMVPTDILLGIQELEGTYTAGNWLGLGWTVGLLLPGLGAVRRLQAPRTQPGPDISTSHSWKPATASLVTSWAFFIAAWSAVLFCGLNGPGDPVAVVMSIMLVLVIVRQVIGQRDQISLNERLRCINQELDGRVRQRTAELAQANAELRADTEELERAHEALQGSQERLRGLFEAEVVAFAFIDHEGVLVDANDRFLRMVAASRGEVLAGALPWSAFVPSASSSADRAAALRADAVGRSDPIEIELAALDGRRFPVLLGRVRLERGGVDAAVVVDLSERRRLEEGLRQAQRLEMLGRVTGGVAHDFNNLLTVIAGYGELLVGTLPPDTPPRRHAEALMDGCERARTLVGQLLTAGRGANGEVREQDLSQLIAGAAGFLRQLAGPGVDLEFALGRGPVLAILDAGQIQQVLMNLVVNARDAMPEGGRITIRLEPIDLDAEAVAGRPGARPGCFALLSVSDTGTGMDAAVRERIFEPFFTTKPPGKGTGLGLATVLSAVRAHEGWIELDSAPQRGSTFRIAFPRFASGRTEVAMEALPPRAAGPDDAPAVLLVDDQAEIREVLALGLEDSGFRVLSAATATEALTLAGPGASQIDVLVVDSQLGGASGRDLVAALRVLAPRLAVVVISAYEAETARLARNDPSLVFLAKPFAVGELVEAVRQAIDRRPA